MMLATTTLEALTAPRFIGHFDKHGDRYVAGLSWATGISIALFFVAALMMAAIKPVQAAEACGGVDLTSTITDASAKADIAKALAETPNGDSLLWKIEKDGLPASYLFGTMHVTDPRVINLPKPAEDAFTSATHLVIETTDVLDPAKASVAMMANPELMTFIDGTTLEGLIAPEDLPMVKERLSERGMPLGSVKLLKPWILAGVLATPACETARKNSGIEILDIHLATRAQKDGKPVEGLETMMEQIGAMASLPIEDHVRGLVETLRLGDKSDDVFETMIALYASGQTAAIMPTLNAALQVEGMSEADIVAGKAFEEKMITNRNKTMAERLPEHLDEGGAFVAIGALHLPGDQGVVQLLKDAGFTVTAVK
jgi:uncharacterized protein